jgi:voltage-gated potassium channel Kch
MAMSPLTHLANDYLTSRWQCKTPEPKYDEIKDETPQIIIAGFGRFGQMFGRLLRAQNFRFVAIDHDADQIELVRRFGSQVYYGDASRVDLLEAAGAKKAKYFILAIDDVEQSLAAAKTAIEHFPHLKIYARARNRNHMFDLKDLGIVKIKRETFDSSIHFVGELLVDMGFAPEKASMMIEKFKRHDEIMLEEQYKVRRDDKQFVDVSKQSTALLAQVLNDDTVQSHISR